MKKIKRNVKLTDHMHKPRKDRRQSLTLMAEFNETKRPPSDKGGEDRATSEPSDVEGEAQGTPKPSAPSPGGRILLDRACKATYGGTKGEGQGTKHLHREKKQKV